MGKWADSTRNEDISTLKKHIAAYIALDPITTPVVPPLPDTKKEDRGFNHPMIARLLIPRADTAVFDAEPEAQASQLRAPHVTTTTVDVTNHILISDSTII